LKISNTWNSFLILKCDCFKDGPFKVFTSEKKELSFSEMQKEFNIENLALNFHLKKLFSSALRDHYYKDEIGNQKYPFYSITQLGRRILSSLINALVPPTTQQE
jgi:DNA-binding HxlR family transcriptional regulator